MKTKRSAFIRLLRFTAITLVIILCFAYPCFRICIRVWAGMRAYFGDVSASLFSLLLVLGTLAIFALIVIFILPCVIYFLKRIFTYLSLAWVCLLSKNRFRMPRVPFASLFRMSEKGDIVLRTEKGELYLHFIDILYPARRALTFPNGKEYVITPTFQSRISKLGGGRGFGPRNNGVFVLFWNTESELKKRGDRIKSLPNIEESPNARHILLLSSSPAHATCVQNGATMPLSSGQPIGAMIYCNVRHVKKELKKQLHVSLFDTKKKQ